MKKTKSSFFLVTLAILLSSCDENFSFLSLTSSNSHILSSDSDLSTSLISSSISISSPSSSSSSSSSSSNDSVTESLDYYKKLDKSLTKASLKSALFSLISPHTVIPYDDKSTFSLNQAYKTTDLREDGTLWDMYSDVKYQYGDVAHVCGGNPQVNYKKEGDCWNKEHSIPKSWFNEKSPMKSDLFHVYPTDGKINGNRSSFLFGEVASAKNTTSNPSSNGSMVGTNKNLVPGGPSTVFEPIDEYKGDFARTYFYMATSYQDKCPSWGGHFSRGAYPSLTDYSLELFLKWNKLDPVSKKETDRNDAVYLLQHNRNPFIDFPKFVTQIWG